MDLHIYDTNHIGNKNKNSIHINWNGEKINKLLEKDRNKIRLKYSNIIHGIIKKNSHDHKFLKIKEINLTKLSLINEKNPFKSSSIHNCLKLLLVEKLVKKKHIKKIYYHGENDEIEKSLKKFSKNLNLDYKNENFILNYSGSKIDYFLKGNIFFIKQIIKNNGLNKNSKMYSNSSIFSYFVHFNTKDRKIFNSNLWGNLNEYFNSKKKLINWFHFYVPSHQVSNSREANFMQENFNLNKFENHNFINSYLSKLELIKTYFLFCNFFFKNCFLLRPKTLFFKNKLSKSNFCFFLEKDFLSSFFGPTLIYNIMNVFIFNNMLKNIPRQKFGLYIIENQSWEYCFIKFWRKYKHGKLIAYFNSSIRFWDLRYLKKNIEYNYKAENPDIYLLNNKIFKNEAKKLGFPNNKIYIVEALRCSRLSPIRKRVNNKKIIIIGDILFEETEYLLDFINKVVSKLRKYKKCFCLNSHYLLHSSIVEYYIFCSNYQ